MAPMIAKMKKIIEGFSTSELKVLLRSAPNAAVKRVTGLSRLRKVEMKEKCFELIENGVIPSTTVLELYKKRTEQQVFKQFKIDMVNATVGEVLASDPTASAVEEEDDECKEVPLDLSVSLSPLPPGLSSDGVASERYHSVISAGDQTESNFFAGSPFYELRAVIMEPIRLKQSMIFTLTPEHAAEFSRVGFEIQVRFGQVDSSGFFNGLDIYPPMLKLKVNGHVVPLHDEMIDLTATPVVLHHINPRRSNLLDISWHANPDDDGVWVMSIYLVKKLTTEDLLKRLRCKGVRLERTTIGMIKKKLARKCVDMTSSATKSTYLVSVRCPIGKEKIVLACRASSCTHVRCFDARTFLESQEEHPFSPLRCPMCNKRVDFDDLRIDEYFQNVLGELSPEDGNKVGIHFDGTWFPA